MKDISEITNEHCLIVADIFGNSRHISDESKIFQVKEVISKLHNGVTNISGYSWYKFFKFCEDNNYKID